MSVLSTTHHLNPAELQTLREPRRDLVAEESIGDDRWQAVEGPFHHYQRSLTVKPLPSNGQADAERFEVEERIDFTLAISVWWPLILPLMRRGLRSTDRAPRSRWWWPREVVPRQTSLMVSAICLISVMTGYLGVVIGQTITFAARDFGSSDSAQANTLAAVRIGVLVSLVFLRQADRIGRRPLLLGFTTAAILFTMAGALSPNMVALGSAQTVARGLTTALITLLVLAATEEVPSSARAFTISLITISAALGAGMVVWVLPLADVFAGGWRLVHLGPVLFLPLIWWVARHLPETRRFTVAATKQPPAVINWRRFTLIGAAAFAAALFLSPSSQLRNEYLRDDLGYSAATISLFQLVISAPAATAIVIAGIAADRVGRRWIGAIGLAGGALMGAVSYQLTGSALWLVASGGVVLSGAALPALRGYQIELFPTRARAKVGGLIDGVAVAGSAAGLVLVGYLSRRWDNLGDAIGVLVFAPVLAAIMIIIWFPETASKDLETFNPDDPDPDSGGSANSGDGAGHDADPHSGRHAGLNGRPGPNDDPDPDPDGFRAVPTSR